MLVLPLLLLLLLLLFVVARSIRWNGRAFRPGITIRWCSGPTRKIQYWHSMNEVGLHQNDVFPFLRIHIYADVDDEDDDDVTAG